MGIRKLVTTVAVLGLAAVSIAADPPAEGTERIYLGIGCQQAEDGATCDSTEYWLGEVAGASSVGTTYSATPLGTAEYYSGGDWSYAQFFSDDSLAESYTLVGDQPILGQVTVGGFIGGAEIAVDGAVRVELSAKKAGGGTIDLGEADVEKPVVTPSGATPDSIVYAFELPANAEFDGVEITSMTMTVHVRGVSVLTNGFVDGEGESFFDLPHADAD